MSKPETAVLTFVRIGTLIRAIVREPDDFGEPGIVATPCDGFNPELGIRYRCSLQYARCTYWTRNGNSYILAFAEPL